VHQHEQISEKDEQLRLRDEKVANLHDVLRQNNKELENRAKVINQKSQELTNKDKAIQVKDQQISQKDEQIQLKDQQISQKDEQIQLKDQQMSQKDQYIRQGSEQILHKVEQIGLLDEKVANLQNTLQQNNRELESQTAIINQKNQQVATRDQTIQQKDRELEARQQIIDQSDAQWKAFRETTTFRLLHSVDSSRIVSFLRSPKAKVNLADQLTAHYGKHRSGWGFALDCLKDLHNPQGVLLDTFLERTFFWHPEGVRPHLQPWIGFIHVPPNVPKWFQYQQSNEMIFQSEVFKVSLPYCKGLFTLSDYHKKALKQDFDFPICNLVHPTQFPEAKWSWDRFKTNNQKKIVQIGWWLRKLHSIFLLPETRYKKIFLRKDDQDMEQLMKIELEHEFGDGTFDTRLYETAETVDFLPNVEYDRLLSENIVLLHLYDSSANNTIIECIARNTPVLVNPLEPVIEYLGDDYPFYFTSLDEAAQKAEDLNLVRETHKYLTNHPIKKRLKGEYFFKSFRKSKIYRNL
jgi:hypothetical protein